MSSMATQSWTQLDLQRNKTEHYVTFLICTPSQILNMQASKTESTWKGKENQMWHEKFIAGELPLLYSVSLEGKTSK